MKSQARKVRIVFESRRIESDEAGNERGPWEFRFECWARRQFLRGGESVMASRLAGISTVVINVESAAMTRAVTTEWRCKDKYTAQLYNITAITPTEDGRDIDILCTTGGSV